MTMVQGDFTGGEISCEEEDGVLVRLVHTFRVSGLTSVSWGSLGEAMGNSAVAPSYATLSGTNLRVVRRRATVVGKGIVDVEVEYGAKKNTATAEDEPAAIDPADPTPTTSPDEWWVWSGSSTLNSEQVTQVSGTPLTVSYTYPATYALDPELQGKTVSQGVSVSILRAAGEMRATGEITLTANTPELLSGNFKGFINSAIWKGCAIGTVMCTGCDYETVDYAAKRYRFTWSFQYKETGHQPEIVFIDPNTGLPPPDLVTNTGRKTLAWYPTVDFNALW